MKSLKLRVTGLCEGNSPFPFDDDHHGQISVSKSNPFHQGNKIENTVCEMVAIVSRLQYVNQGIHSKSSV